MSTSASEPAPAAGVPSGAVPSGAAPRDAAARLDFDDPLARPSADDTDAGWGDRPASGGGAADLARFLDEKPPHHI